jgi:hypothetical protein
VQDRWTRFGSKAGLGALTFALACGSALAASNASVAGVVRNAQGAAQPGAMVEVLAAGSAAVATAFTDIYGRYRIANLTPGKYEVRATAALFLPATRMNLSLVTGMRATVNLTMNMLADPAVWLPAERRKADEPGDDWTWTLRSASNRPILRVLPDGTAVLTSSDDEQRRRATRVRAAVMGGDAGFGEGGIHNVIALNRVPVDGSDVVLQADLGVGVGIGIGLGVGDGGLGANNLGANVVTAPSAEVDAGYERTGPLGASRMVMSYASHPEMQSTDGADGMQWMRMSSAQQMRMGELAEIEAGGTIYAIRANGYALSTQPFLRVTLHPGQVWAVRYGLATSHEMQNFGGLDALGSDLPAAAMVAGRLTAEGGMHQEIAVTRKAGGGMVRVAVYHDDIGHSAIAGAGATDAAELGGSPAVVDTATGSFRMLESGYSSNGVSVAVAQPVASEMWASIEYMSGAGMAAPGGDGRQQFAAAVAALHPVSSCAATAALQGGFAKAGTKVRASYRWQPHAVVTAVNSYGSASDQAFLSFYVRQAISLGGRLPQGLEATVDVTNLLAEGYHPFLSADGRILYLAQAPRSVRAGLAFNF